MGKFEWNDDNCWSANNKNIYILNIQNYENNYYKNNPKSNEKDNKKYVNRENIIF